MQATWTVTIQRHGKPDVTGTLIKGTPPAPHDEVKLPTADGEIVKGTIVTIYPPIPSKGGISLGEWQIIAKEVA